MLVRGTFSGTMVPPPKGVGQTYPRLLRPFLYALEFLQLRDGSLGTE